MDEKGLHYEDEGSGEYEAKDPKNFLAKDIHTIVSTRIR